MFLELKYDFHYKYFISASSPDAHPMQSHNGWFSFKEAKSNPTYEKLEQQQMSEMFLRHFVQSAVLMTFPTLKDEKNHWIVPQMIDNVLEKMKNLDENDRDNDEEEMKIEDENDGDKVMEERKSPSRYLRISK